MSDEWRAYNAIPNLDMAHQTVNHSLNFVDPSTGAHTQGIESTWSQAKRMMKREGVMSTSPALFPTYLPEFLWSRYYILKIHEMIREHPLPTQTLMNRIIFVVTVAILMFNRGRDVFGVG